MLDKENVKSKNLNLDKATQTDYIIQNYDLFPDMYDVIDAQAKNDINKNNKIIQTKRFILKDMPTPYYHQFLHQINHHPHHQTQTYINQHLHQHLNHQVKQVPQ